MTILLKNDKLKVVSANLVHENHLANVQVFNHYPDNMRMTAEETATANTMLAVDGKKQKVKAFLMKKRSEAGVH